MEDQIGGWHRLCAPGAVLSVDRIVSYTWAHIQGEHDEEDIAVGTSQQCAEVAHAVRRGAVVAGTERGPTGAEVHSSM